MKSCKDSLHSLHSGCYETNEGLTITITITPKQSKSKSHWNSHGREWKGWLAGDMESHFQFSFQVSEAFPVQKSQLPTSCCSFCKSFSLPARLQQIELNNEWGTKWDDEIEMLTCPFQWERINSIGWKELTWLDLIIAGEETFKLPHISFNFPFDHFFLISDSHLCQIIWIAFIVMTRGGSIRMALQGKGQRWRSFAEVVTWTGH